MSRVLILLAMVLSSMVFGYSNDPEVLVAQNCQIYDENGCSSAEQVPEAEVYLREPAAEQVQPTRAEIEVPYYSDEAEQAPPEQEYEE